MSTPAAESSSRVGALVLTACSFVLAGTTGWLIWKLLAAGGPGAEAFREVVVAARSIEAGRPLEAPDLRVVPWPVAALPEGFIERPAELLSPPRVLFAGAIAGEPILRARLAGGGGLWLGAIVQPDARAVAIRLDREVAASRFVYPGAHVDVLATMEDPRKHTFSTATVLQDVRVLAVGRHADVDGFRRGAGARGAAAALGSGDEAEGVAFVQVSPHDAERLSLAQRTGKIDLVVRNATDGKSEATAGAWSGDLVSVVSAAPDAIDHATDRRRRRVSRRPGAGTSASAGEGEIRVYHAPVSSR